LASFLKHANHNSTNFPVGFLTTLAKKISDKNWTDFLPLNGKTSGKTCGIKEGGKTSN